MGYICDTLASTMERNERTFDRWLRAVQRRRCYTFAPMFKAHAACYHCYGGSARLHAAHSASISKAAAAAAAEPEACAVRENDSAVCVGHGVSAQREFFIRDRARTARQHL